MLFSSPVVWESALSEVPLEPLGKVTQKKELQWRLQVDMLVKWAQRLWLGCPHTEQPKKRQAVYAGSERVISDQFWSYETVQAERRAAST